MDSEFLVAIAHFDSPKIWLLINLGGKLEGKSKRPETNQISWLLARSINLKTSEPTR